MQEDKIIKRIPTNLVTKRIITSSAEYEPNKEYTDDDANVYEKYLQAITKVSIDINSDIEKIKALEDNILEQYNKNAELEKKMEQETEKFAEQANTAIKDYNSNAETKIEEFNTNAKEKTDEFDSNATEKKSEINTISENFKKMAETKTTEFDNNSDTKTEEFNNNSTEKTNAFNSNAEEKIADYNEHVETLTSRIADLEEETEDLYNALNTEQISGNELYIDDAKPCRILNTGINGMYAQETTEGVNLYSSKKLTTVTQYGITRTILPDGGIRVQGSATEQYNMRITTNDVATLKKGNYTLVCYGLPTNLSINIYYIGNVTGENIKEIVSDGTKVYHMELAIQKGTAVNCTLYPFLLSGSYDASNIPAYEPYTEGNPSPNPDYPQVIEQVESVKLNICNKNLLDNINKYKYDEVSSELNDGTVTLNSNGSVMIDARKATKSMTIKSKFYTNNIPMLLPAGTYYTTVKLNTQKISNKTLIQFQEGSFIIDEPIYIHQWYCTCEVGKIRTVLPQIEVGKELTEPEQHLKTQINIDLKGNKLCAVSDTIKDKLLIDKNGNVALQKNVSLITLKKDNIASRTVLSNGDILYRTTRNIINSNNIFVLCNYYRGIKDFLSRTDGTIYCNNPNKNSIDIIDNNANITTVDGYKTFVENNQIEVYYAVETPKIIDLGQLPELLKTFNGINNIWAETNLGNTEIEIEYVQDVKKLLEKQAEQQNARLDNIEALLSTTETSALLLDNMQNDLEKEVE